MNAAYLQEPQGPDEEGDGLHHQSEPLRHLRPGQQLQPQLRDHRQWPNLFERGGYEGRGAVALHERRLLRQRFDCARARVDAYARLRARAQSDTGVGRILVFPLAFPEFLRKGFWEDPEIQETPCDYDFVFTHMQTLSQFLLP